MRNVERVGFVAPRTQNERRLAEIWCDLLNVDTIGVEDNFFNFGGDSLQLVRLQIHVRETFGVEMSLNVLFENRTIAAIAERISTEEDKP